MSTVDNRLISFKSGYPWRHTAEGTDPSRFFGVAYDSGIALLVNEGQSKVNVYNAVSVEGTKPSRVHFRTEVPNAQSSDLVGDEFRTKEGVHYCEILRDRLSPNVAVVDEDNAYNEKLNKGDRVRGQYMKCMITYDATIPAEIRFAGFNIISSVGHGK
jgi:hypothetical protein